MNGIGAAPAEVARHAFSDLLVATRIAFLDERSGGHDLPGCAEATLESVVVDERLLHRVQAVAVGEALDRTDGPAVQGGGQCRDTTAPDARRRAPCRPALAVVTALLGSRQIELVSQHVEQRGSRVDVKVLGSTVDGALHVHLMDVGGGCPGVVAGELGDRDCGARRGRDCGAGPAEESPPRHSRRRGGRRIQLSYGFIQRPGPSEMAGTVAWCGDARSHAGIVRRGHSWLHSELIRTALKPLASLAFTVSTPTAQTAKRWSSARRPTGFPCRLGRSGGPARLAGISFALVAATAKTPPTWLIDTIGHVRNVLRTAGRSAVPPNIALLEIAQGAWLTQALYVAVELGIADKLRDGPRTSADIASAVGADPGATYRVMRALAANGLLKLRRDGRFSLTRVGQALRSDFDGSMAPMIRLLGHPEHWEHWGQLLHSVRTGEPAAEKVRGAPIFDYLETNPEYAKVFNDAMTGVSAMAIETAVPLYTFADRKLIVDVGERPRRPARRGARTGTRRPRRAVRPSVGGRQCGSRTRPGRSRGPVHQDRRLVLRGGARRR